MPVKTIPARAAIPTMALIIASLSDSQVRMLDTQSIAETSVGQSYEMYTFT